MTACIAKKENGMPCGAPVMENSQFCFFHNPDQKITKKRKLAATVGGLSGKRKPQLEPVRIKNSADLAELLEGLINDIRGGKIGTAEANAVVYAACTLAKVFETRDLVLKYQAIELVLKQRTDNDG